MIVIYLLDLQEEFATPILLCLAVRYISITELNSKFKVKKKVPTSPNQFSTNKVTFISNLKMF